MEQLYYVVSGREKDIFEILIHQLGLYEDVFVYCPEQSLGTYHILRDLVCLGSYFCSTTSVKLKKNLL